MSRTESEVLVQTEAIVETIDIPVEKIKPSPYQPRMVFNLEDLRETIKRDGILVPLTVREIEGIYELIDGERRLRLSKELGYKTVPATVIDVDDETARRLVWKVNTLRQDYTPYEKAKFFETLYFREKLSLKAMGRDYDYAVESINAYLNILRLPTKYQEIAWNTSSLGVSHIRELQPFFPSLSNVGVEASTPLKDENLAPVIKYLDDIIENRRTHREVREAIRPELEEIRERRVDAARKAATEAAQVQPEIELKAPETPEEFVEAAQVLIKEAQRRKSPEQILEEKRDKAKSSLSSGRGSVLSKIETAVGLGLDNTEFEKRYTEIEGKIPTNPDEAYEDIKKLKNDINKVVNDVKRKQREEKLKEEVREEVKTTKEEMAKELEEEKKRLEEEAEKRLEEEREKLLTDRNFIKKAAEMAPILEELPKREGESPTIAPSPEEVEAVRKRLRETRQRLREIMETPVVKERGLLFMNWVAHQAILDVLGGASCPVCGEGWENLEWKCHNLNVKKAYEHATEEYQKSIKGGEPD